MLTPEEKAAVKLITAKRKYQRELGQQRVLVDAWDLDLLLSALSRLTSPEWEAMEEAAKRIGELEGAYDHTPAAREYAEILRDTSGAIRALGRRLANAEGEG